MLTLSPQVGTGKDDFSALARVSIVNYRGEVLYDSYVKPPERVVGNETCILYSPGPFVSHVSNNY